MQGNVWKTQTQLVESADMRDVLVQSVWRVGEKQRKETEDSRK